MKAYVIKVKMSASKQIKNLPTVTQEKIMIAIENLAYTARPIGVKKLKGTASTYRIRVGVYRIVYQIIDDELIIVIIDVDHRKQVYR